MSTTLRPRKDFVPVMCDYLRDHINSGYKYISRTDLGYNAAILTKYDPDVIPPEEQRKAILICENVLEIDHQVRRCLPEAANYSPTIYRELPKCVSDRNPKKEIRDVLNQYESIKPYIFEYSSYAPVSLSDIEQLQKTVNTLVANDIHFITYDNRTLWVSTHPVSNYSGNHSEPRFGEEGWVKNVIDRASQHFNQQELDMVARFVDKMHPSEDLSMIAYYYQYAKRVKDGTFKVDWKEKLGVIIE